MIRRILLYLCLVIILSFITAFSWIRLTEIGADELTDLKNGDVIFQTTSSDLTFPIMLASTSLYTHVGIVKILPDGTRNVVEAAGPVREIPLDDWIKSGVFQRISVMRIKGMTPEKAEKALIAADMYKGIPYDFFFLLSDDQFYCSELVYKAFLNVGVVVGKKERVRDLSVANYAVQNYIEKWWYKHPVCRAQGIKGYNECVKLILDQQLVTPVSLAKDPNLRMVYTNYGPEWFVSAH
ncbi:MAG: YiiX/YebB-like N1pC/P60 family cysteine hydrolase [Methyloligellaceae bacterium]